MTADLVAGGEGLALGLAVSLLAAVVRRWVLLKRLARQQKLGIVVDPPLDKVQDEVIFFAALLEQGRRESELAKLYPVKGRALVCRPDQRLRMIQQRLSRDWGERAFSLPVKKRIEETLNGLDHQE